MPRTQEIVKVAAVQAAPVSFDLPKSLAKVAHFTAEAAKAGADLVVFPYVIFMISCPEKDLGLLVGHLVLISSCVVLVRGSFQLIHGDTLLTLRLGIGSLVVRKS